MILVMGSGPIGIEVLIVFSDAGTGAEFCSDNSRLEGSVQTSPNVFEQDPQHHPTPKPSAQAPRANSLRFWYTIIHPEFGPGVKRNSKGDLDSNHENVLRRQITYGTSDVNPLPNGNHN